jgi:hypothetical protein
VSHARERFAVARFGETDLDRFHCYPAK